MSFHHITDADITDQRSYTSNDHKRYIITAYDANNDGTINNSDVVALLPENFEDADGNIGLLNTDTDEEAADVINFIRGQEVAGLRSRELDGEMERLGDIIYSTPTAVGRPAENLHLLYNDSSYETFLRQYRDRRTVVYVGGNDGLLHAFNGGWAQRNGTDGEFAFRTQLVSGETSTGIDWDLGQEIWAYAPYNVLPHLRHITEADYGLAEGDHMYFVDQKPRVFDAKIFADSDDHPGGWGTIMVVGFRLGGGETTVVTNPNASSAAHVEKTVRPAYAIFDITNPEKAPNLLWEFSHEMLGASYAIPAPFTPDGGTTWYLMLGSGPDSTPEGFDEVKSTQNAHLFLLDLNTMSLESTFGTSGILDTSETQLFCGRPYRRGL